jgi:hypothetical protein
MCDGSARILIPTIIICLIIGLPSIIIGCDDFSCPLYEKVMANVTDSRYLVTQCTKNICNVTRVCENTQSNCSHWVSTVSYLSDGLKNCDVGTGPHESGTNIHIYVNKKNGECNVGFDTTIRALPYVGIVFLSIGGLASLVLIIGCCTKIWYESFADIIGCFTEIIGCFFQCVCDCESDDD